MMSNEEREQTMKMAEMLLPLYYVNMPKNLKGQVHAKAESLGISGDAFLIRLVEKMLWSRALATADMETTIAAIKERLSKLPYELMESAKV